MHNRFLLFLPPTYPSGRQWKTTALLFHTRHYQGIIQSSRLLVVGQTQRPPGLSRSTSIRGMASTAHAALLDAVSVRSPECQTSKYDRRPAKTCKPVQIFHVNMIQHSVHSGCKPTTAVTCNRRSNFCNMNWLEHGVDINIAGLYRQRWKVQTRK